MPDTAAIITPLEIGSGACRAVIKDSIDIAGLPTRCGSAALDDAPRASNHALVVALLLDKDYCIVGKAGMHELAYGLTGINDIDGTPRNPRFPQLVPGGSSSGSATAVASGDAEIGIGTDTGGSIRIPAACCGIAGLKPSFGAVSRKGVLPVKTTLDCVGPFARDVSGIEAAMEAMSPGFAIAEMPSVPRLARLVLPPGFEADPDIHSAIENALKGTEATLREVELPAFAAAYDAALTVIGSEMAAGFAHLLSGGKIGADVAARLANAMSIEPHAIEAAEEVRRLFRAQVDRVLETCDALVLPTLPGVPPSLADGRDPAVAVRLTRYLRQFNLSHHPAISLPILTEAGMPAGLQLVGRRGGDAALCALARWFETRLRR